MKLSTIINKIISKNGARPVLENFIFKDGKLSCTDLEIALTFTYPKLEIFETDAFLVDAKMLSKLLDNKGFLSGQIDGKTLELKANKGSFKLPAYPTDEFPDIPFLSKDEFKTFELNNSFMESLKKASHCAQRNRNRLLLNSIKLDFHNGLAVATDQVRLSAQYIQKIEELEREDIIIPLKAFEVLKSLPDPEAFRLNDSCISFLHNDYIFTTRLVETQFPNYISAMTTYEHRDYSIQLNKEELTDALKDLDLMAQAGFNAKLQNGELSILSSKGEASHKLGMIQHEAIGVNHYFLADYLKTISKGTSFKLGFQGPKNPITIQDSNGFLFMSRCNAS